MNSLGTSPLIKAGTETIGNRAGTETGEQGWNRD